MAAIFLGGDELISPIQCNWMSKINADRCGASVARGKPYGLTIATVATLRALIH